MSKKQLVFFVFVFAVLLVGRLCIAGAGYLEDQDEFLYIWIHANFPGFIHLATWRQCIFRIQGQPPEIAIRLFEYITLLPLSSATGKQMLHPDILYFVGLYNILVSLITLYVFFRILRKLDFSVTVSLTGVLLLGTLFNYNMYTRHILPYENAFLFQLLAFNLLLRDNLRPRTILFAGLLSAIGLTNYMGGFMFIFINGGYLVFANYKDLKVALKIALLFVLPFVGLLLFFEVLVRMEGRSYINFLRGYANTVGTEGSYEEGLTYVFLYFKLVEKWWGLLLLLLSVPGMYMIFSKSRSAKTKRVMLLGIIAYLAFGGTVFFLHKLVFEGRVLHIYYPFIIIGVLGLIQQQKLLPVNRILLPVVFFACLNYCFVIRDFNRIGYPRNAIYKYHLFEEKGKTSFTYYDEISPSINYGDRKGFFIDSVGNHILPSGHYVLKNIAFLVTAPDSLLKSYKPRPMAKTDSVVFEELDYESHPAYTMEYCTRTGRQFYLDHQLKIQVIKTKAP